MKNLILSFVLFVSVLSMGQQMLDSSRTLLWDDNTSSLEHWRRSSYAYDAYGNMTYESIYSWADTHFETNTHYARTYDANNRMVSEYRYSGADDGVSWEKRSRTSFTYDGNGNKVLTIDSTWDKTRQLWYLDEKEELTYNAYDNVTLEMEYEWDTVNTVWVDDNRFVNTYSDSSLITATWETWDDFDNDWRFVFYKDSLVYNVDGLVVEAYELDEDFDGNWEFESLVLNRYDGSGNLTEEIELDYSNDWDTTSKYLRSYDVNNNMLSKHRLSWQESDSTWLNVSVDSITYKANQDRDAYVVYVWEDNAWRLNNTVSYEVNDVYTTDDLWQTAFFNDNFKGALLSYQQDNWSSDLGDLHPWQLLENFFSVAQASGISNEQSTEFGVYPNPVSSLLTLDLGVQAGAVEIYSLQGLLITALELKEGQVIDVSKLTKGQYLIQIQNEGTIHHSSFYKQ